MTPIVNGLETEYSEKVAFVRVNAGEGEGEQLFRQLGLPGHPSYVVFSTAGQETFRTFGVVDSERLKNALEDVLRKSD